MILMTCLLLYRCIRSTAVVRLLVVMTGLGLAIRLCMILIHFLRRHKIAFRRLVMIEGNVTLGMRRPWDRRRWRLLIMRLDGRESPIRSLSRIITRKSGVAGRVIIRRDRMAVRCDWLMLLV